MGGGAVAEPGGYSANVGAVYVFNLIVGAGALTMPHAFAQVGILPGTCFLLFLSLLGYVCATFVVEGMALSNAMLVEESGAAGRHLEAVGQDEGDDGEGNESEDSGLVPKKATQQFHIVQKVEMSKMASLFLGRNGTLCFYAAIIAYLYGDLAIYAVAVPKSLRDLVCPLPSDLTVDSLAVWDCIHPGQTAKPGHAAITPLGTWLGNTSGRTMNSIEVYRCFCMLFTVTFGPCAFLSITKSKWVQLVTTVLRHVAFSTMIIVAALGIVYGEGVQPPSATLEHTNFSALPTLFGVAIYSFMCHHSIPSMIFPIQRINTVDLNRLFLKTYTAVLVMYLFFVFTATFRFPPDQISDLYTLNFTNYKVRAVALLLSIYPLAAMGSVFPIICVSLRENLKTMLLPSLLQLSAGELLAPPLPLACSACYARPSGLRTPPSAARHRPPLHCRRCHSGWFLSHYSHIRCLLRCLVAGASRISITHRSPANRAFVLHHGLRASRKSDWFIPRCVHPVALPSAYRPVR
jgi:hypothetical protein